jgi:hypothetical protein
VGKISAATLKLSIGSHQGSSKQEARHSFFTKYPIAPKISVTPCT